MLVLVLFINNFHSLLSISKYKSLFPQPGSLDLVVATVIQY